MIEELGNKNSKYGEFTDESLKSSKSAVARRIKTAAAKGEITGASDIIGVSLYAWRHWGNAIEAASFMASTTSSDQELVKFLKNFIYNVNSASSGDKVITATKRLALQQLSESLDLNALHDRLAQMELQKLNETDRDVAAFALEQLTKMREKRVTPEPFDQSRLFLDEDGIAIRRAYANQELTDRRYAGHRNRVDCVVVQRSLRQVVPCTRPARSS